MSKKNQGPPNPMPESKPRNKENKPTSLPRILDASHLFRKKQELTESFVIPYSHEYELYLDFLKQIACATVQFEVINIPTCWIPFVLYHGHTIGRTKDVWDCDKLAWAIYYDGFEDKRRAVEIASECRPELVHALYLADTEWFCPRRQHVNQQEFVVTGNGSFHRPEVLQYMQLLKAFPKDTSKTIAVIVPCAADKPYPSEMHKAVSDLFGDDDRFHLIIATGVLGLVPEELFPVMPKYDSGLPNQLRVTQTVEWYFKKWHYDRVIVYSDFYAQAIFQGISKNVIYLFGAHYRVGYENLLKPEHLARLESALHDGCNY